MDREVDHMNDVNRMDYTNNAERLLDDLSYEDNKLHDLSPVEIYNVLKEKVDKISFKDYLIRFMVRNTGMTLAELPDRIIDKFEETLTPFPNVEEVVPFYRGIVTVRNRQLVNRWLSQNRVNRRVIFYLGFGLDLREDEVNEFLMKGIGERGINPKDPFEVICKYCYNYSYGYEKFKELWREYQDLAPASSQETIFNEETNNVMHYVDSMKFDDNAENLMNYLSMLKAEDGRSKMSVSCTECYYTLKSKIEKIVQDEESAGCSKGRLEEVLSSGIQTDRNGNKRAAKYSRLKDKFTYRVNRQHFNALEKDISKLTREDLITMNFFIYATKYSEKEFGEYRVEGFRESTNELLEKCSLGELFVSNPYEWFILACMYSEDPLDTYASVYEIIYAEE